MNVRNLWKLNILLRERDKKTEGIRKQMKVTKRCGRELDILLGLLGIDYSTLELCPIPSDAGKKTQNRERRR